MKIILKTVTILAISFTFLPSEGFSRGPAVEPVRGISIDDYQEIPPSQAKGYEFRKGQPKSLTRKTASKNVTNWEQVNNKSEQQVYGPDPSWPMSIILLVLVLMPFGLWYSIMKSLDQKEIGLPENTIPFPTAKNSHDDDDGNDDFNLPKAS